MILELWDRAPQGILAYIGEWHTWLYGMGVYMSIKPSVGAMLVLCLPELKGFCVNENENNMVILGDPPNLEENRDPNSCQISLMISHLILKNNQNYP